MKLPEKPLALEFEIWVIRRGALHIVVFRQP